MPDFSKQDKHVISIYQKAMATHEQYQEDFEFRMEEEAIKELDSQFWGYLNGRLRVLVMNVTKIQQMKIPKKLIDDAERGVSDLLTMTSMYSHPVVIAQLINEAEAERQKKKMLAKLESEG